jgi:hypothetical protein
MQTNTVSRQECYDLLVIVMPLYAYFVALVCMRSSKRLCSGLPGRVKWVVVTAYPLVAPLDPSTSTRICISTGKPSCSTQSACDWQLVPLPCHDYPLPPVWACHHSTHYLPTSAKSSFGLCLLLTMLPPGLRLLQGLHCYCYYHSCYD